MLPVVRNVLRQLSCKYSKVDGVRARAVLSSRCYSDGVVKGEDKVYEIRDYTIRPEKYAAALELLDKYFHFRLNFSKPLGFWLVELGGIFQTVHIWPYDSVSQRAAIRKDMGGDHAEWKKDFLGPFMSTTISMQHAVTVLRPRTKLCTDYPASPNAVYELMSFPTNQGEGPSGKALSDKETLVGQFKSIYGDTNLEYRLLRYPDPDTAFEHARKRLEERSKVSGYSRLMLPHPKYSSIS